MLKIFGLTMCLIYGCSQITFIIYREITDSSDIDNLQTGLKQIRGMGGRK